MNPRVEWSEVTQEQVLPKNPKLLPKIPSATNLQLYTNDVVKSIPDAVTPEVARKGLQQLLDSKYNNIVSKSAADIGRTKLIEVDIPTEGLAVASKLYREFVEHEIKQLKEAETISRSMSDWASPILSSQKRGANREFQ